MAIKQGNNHMSHTEGLGAASFFEYRDAIKYDFQQFYLTQTKRLKREIAEFKSSCSDVFSFSGFNCLSDDEPVKMNATQIAKVQIQSISRHIALRYQRQSDLKSLRDLSNLSDSTLTDIGFTRGDINYVKTLPLTMSPADELNKISGHQHSRLI